MDERMNELILQELQNINSFLNTLPLDFARPPKRQSVKIEDFNMPFWNLAGLLIKIALASIPAMLILVFLGFIVSTVFSVFVLGALSSLIK